MKIALVCGGRGYTDMPHVFHMLDHLHEMLGFDTILQGGARGADTLAQEWAQSRGVPFITVPANWKRYGNSAGPLRNSEMLLLKPFVVIAFDGGSGTEDMIRQATINEIEVRRV